MMPQAFPFLSLEIWGLPCPAGRGGQVGEGWKLDGALHGCHLCSLLGKKKKKEEKRPLPRLHGRRMNRSTNPRQSMGPRRYREDRRVVSGLQGTSFHLCG